MNMNERTLLILFSILSVVPGIFLIIGGGMGFMMGSGIMGEFESIGMAIFWILIIVGAYLLLLNRVQPNGYERHNPLKIASERFACGEISVEEYEEIQLKLSQNLFYFLTHLRAC